MLNVVYVYVLDVKHFVCSIQFISYFSYEIKHKMIQLVTLYCSHDVCVGVTNQVITVECQPR